MKRYGKLCREWKRALCLACSLALVLSAVPAPPVLAEETAGQELLPETGTEGTETAGAGQTEESVEETAQPENNGEDDGGQNPGGDGTEETGQDLDGLENSEDAVMDQEETDTEESDGDIADMETDITVDMDDQAAEEDGTAENDDETVDRDTEDGNRAEHGETEETAMPYSLDNAYTDAQGNVFNYVLDDEGNAVITGITLSGQALEIPDSINGAAVAAVSGGGNSCVVSNPETAIPSLYVDCGSVGAYAFSDLHIGTLTIGENVASFEESTEGSVSSHYWGQFAGTVIGTLHYNARNAGLGHCYGVGLTNSLEGPFHEADIGVMDIGDMVGRIPEALLYQASLHMDGGEIDLHVPEIGAYAFAGGGVSIGRLEIGREVSVFRESYYSSVSSHHWKQFAGADIGTLCLYAADLEMEHRAGKGLTNDIYPPFEGAEIGMFEVGAEVTVIPEYLLYQASISMDELEIHAATIGAYAFAGENISIGMLVIGKEVEKFEEDYYSTVSSHYWSHFKGVTVGTLRLLAENLATGHTEVEGLINSIYPPFDGAAVGTLEIGESVTAIPEYLLYGAKMEMDELEIHVPKVGAYAFASENISIGTLTLGEEVAEFTEDYYSSVSSHYWRQFAGVTVGTLHLLAKNLATVHTEGEGLTNSIYPPFEGAAVGMLEIGESVTAIPEYLLYGAKMEMDELEIHVPKIGAYAFASENISIGTLVIGKEVETFEEDYYSLVSSHYWRQFAGVTVGTLQLLAENLATAHTEGEGLTNSIYPPFEGAAVGMLEIGESVTAIPEYLLYQADMRMDELEIHVPKIGAYAFASENISIGTLVIGKEVETFEEDYYSLVSSHYWRQFAGVTVGTLQLLAENLATVHTEGEGLTNSIYAPFEKADVGVLEIGGSVTAVPEYFLYNSFLTMDALEIHVPKIGAYAFAGSGISIGTLTIGREVAVFSEDYFSTVSSHYWNQFMEGRFGRVVYAADCAESENDVVTYGTFSTYIYGPFQKSEIGTLAIADNVERIPDYLFYNAKMALDDLAVNVPVIGAQAFRGAGIAIKTLTIGERVEHLAAAKYGSSSYRYWEQFRDADIGTVNYNAVSAVLDGSGTGASYYYSPFYKTGIDTLNLGDGVDAIPAFLFYEAILEQEELAIHARAVGSSAFYSSGISIGALTIGEEVEELSFVKSGSYYYFRQFGSMGIGTLIYEPKHAATGANCSAGPFHNASVGSVSFGNGVVVIPNYLFYNAKIAFGDFTVNIPAVGCYSFSGPDISFGDLTVGENVSSFLVNASNYSRAFYNSAVEGSLNYDAVDARLDTSASNAYGPFYDTAAGSLSVGENVRYLDRRLFRGNSFERCTVYAVAASEEHLGQTLTASYLPESKYLNIHHNSGFADYFTAKAEETDWMCRDFFTVTYGDKVFDGDSGEYMVEVMRECSVCGYTEGGIEDLDDSYEVRLSIPVEVPLFFSGSKKSYEGSARVYAYGRLGNAYEGVRLSVDSAAENFGLAETGGEKVDVSPYLTVGFSSGSEAVFTPAQVLGNGEAFSNGDTEKLYMDSLAVSVKGIAFLRSGTGDYAIPVPLRVEIF